MNLILFTIFIFSSLLFVGQKVPSPTPPGKKISSQKRRRNYSSYECGAKIVAANTEAEGTSRILNELVDEYMLNPCKAKIWFVIELCETVQASQACITALYRHT